MELKEQDLMYLKPEHELTIRCYKGGNIVLTGPVQYKIFCLGLLECAKDAINKAHETADKEESAWAKHNAQVVPGGVLQ